MARQGIWENLVVEVLAEVFSRLPFQERLCTVPLVCKSWKRASYDPACWRSVDMKTWFQTKVDEDYWWEFDCEAKIEFLMKKVVDRSSGQLQKLQATHCSNASIEYIAERCPLLTVLFIPDSHLVTDKAATTLANNCPKLQELDISDCYKISEQALEAIGRNCTSLVWLRRNMLQNQNHSNPAMFPEGDKEAIAVSKHMVKLKHLEMKRTSLSDLGLEHLARGCEKLEILNLACCEWISSTGLEMVSKQCTRLKEFTKPITPRLHVNPDPSCYSWMLAARLA